MDEATKLAELARAYVESARQNLEAGSMEVAFAEARLGAELACKAIICRETGTYPRHHNPAGDLAKLTRMPPGVSPQKLSRLLQEHTRGRYPMDSPLERTEIKSALEIAVALLKELDR